MQDFYRCSIPRTQNYPHVDPKVPSYVPKSSASMASVLRTANRGAFFISGYLGVCPLARRWLLLSVRYGGSPSRLGCSELDA